MYVYRRRDGSSFELHQPIAMDALAICPTTGQSVQRVMQPFTPHYRGTGFYSTDHGKAPPSASNAAGDASGTPPENAGRRRHHP